MEVKKMSKELEVNWKTKHKKFGEIHIKSINLDSNYMWTDNEECSCIGADSTLAKELFPTIPMLMNKELKQSLDELEELKQKQEKKDELLGLYKEKISILENSKYLNRFSRSFDIEEVNKLLKVITKISKLEEEMK
jgi:hypothetical protein